MTPGPRWSRSARCSRRTARVADLDAIARRRRGARRAHADRHDAGERLAADRRLALDYVAVRRRTSGCCATRGRAFLRCATPAGSPRCRLSPPGWYAAEPRGIVLRPGAAAAGDARRLDMSPAWLAWVARRRRSSTSRRAEVEAIHAHDVRAGEQAARRARHAARRLRASSRCRPGAATAPVAAGLRVGGLARARICLHLYNDEDDVERVVRGAGLDARARPRSRSAAASASRPVRSITSTPASLRIQVSWRLA